MNILLTNDDGVYAEGIKVLAQSLRPFHNLTIAAPATQKSGAAHSLTLRETLTVLKVELEGLEDVPTYSVSGTPADCVKLTIGSIIAKPDLVISGINMGANLGTDAFYSGTVSAAMEATIMGCPAIAMSICSHNPENLITAGEWTLKAIEVMYSAPGGMPACSLLSVNVPDIPASEVRGMRFVPLCRRAYPADYTPTEADPTIYMPPRWGLEAENADEHNDFNAVMAGYVSMTSLLTDLTDFAGTKAVENYYNNRDK